MQNISLLYYAEGWSDWVSNPISVRLEYIDVSGLPPVRAQESIIHLFHLEKGGRKLLPKVGTFLQVHKMPHPR
jgi:hypothetical protein